MCLSGHVLFCFFKRECILHFGFTKFVEEVDKEGEMGTVNYEFRMI